ncbi:uncharacterized protein Dyak_GE27751, isoform B [Drosophila yakuba]|uniref:Uncharacterized protein, isoform B n=1 Tax=Drosophila yakuba TaxID=7245 RepID=A0A0R1E197_DROYA|nr:uncharacterized protein Dyak_GE27751, isoform B [Drosophila yakuba]
MELLWTTAYPTFSNAPQINLDKLMGGIFDVVNAGINLHFPQQKSESGKDGDRLHGGGSYSKGQSGGPPIIGVSKYDIIDLKSPKPN